MSTSGAANNSGEGTRPVTSAGADNLGAGKRFVPGAPEVEAPAEGERMGEKRLDKEAVEHDDSAPLGLTGPAASTPNTEPPQTEQRNLQER